MKKIIVVALALACAACSRELSQDSNQEDLKTAKRIQDVALVSKTHLKLSQLARLQLKAKPAVSYWKDPEPLEQEDNEPIDVMTQSLISDLQDSINDFEIDDASKAAAISKLVRVKCKKRDLKEAFGSIAFLKSDVKKTLIADIIQNGTPVAREAIKEVINELKDSEEFDASWIEFASDAKDKAWFEDIDEQQDNLQDFLDDLESKEASPAASNSNASTMIQ